MAQTFSVDGAIADAVIGVTLIVAIDLQVWLTPSVHEPLVPMLGGVLFGGAVAVRRRWAIAGVSAILLVLAVKTVLNPQQGALHSSVGVMPCLLLVFYGLGAFAPTRQSRWVAGAALMVTSANLLATPGRPVASLIPAEGIILCLPYGLGVMMRVRAGRAQAERERAEQLDSVRDLTARTAAYQERARVARELHDVIAHSVSVMVIQAGGARMVMDADPDRAEASLCVIERAGREALAEMRRLLGLFDSGRDLHALAPQPGLADIDQLVSRAKGSGLTAAVRVEGQPVVVPPGLDLCAYRVVQEALTNAIKHVAPARADVCIRWTDDQLEVEVSDDGHGPGTSPPAGGHGLVGMRERVALHGGSLFAGVGPEGGFTVRACLPIVAGAPL